MLDSHPEISFAEEFDYALRSIGDDGTFPSRSSFEDSVRLDRMFATSGFEIDPTLDFPQQINAFLESRRTLHNASVVGATVRSGFSKAKYLWPDVRFIHLIRDPRDVAPERIAAGLAGTPWHAATQWAQVEDEWSRVEQSTPPDRLCTVNFDDLVTDHHSTLTRLCRFLGVDYTTQMLDYSRDTDFREPSKNLAGDWRRSLNPDGVRLVEARVGERLPKNGFSPSGLSQVEISDRRLAFLRWQDRAGRLRGRFRSYGIRLTTAELAARAVNNRPLQQSIRLKLNQVEAASRKKSWSDEAKYRTSR